MRELYDFVVVHWLVITLMTGLILAVLFVWTHKQRLFYNKP